MELLDDSLLARSNYLRGGAVIDVSGGFYDTELSVNKLADGDDLRSRLRILLGVIGDGHAMLA